LTDEERAADDDNPPEAHAIGFMTGLVIIAAIMGTVAIFGMLTGKKVKFEVKLGNAEMKVGVEGGAPTPGGGESGRDEEDSDSDGSGEPDPAPDPGDGGDGDGGGGSDSGGGADNCFRTQATTATTPRAAGPPPSHQDDR